MFSRRKGYHLSIHMLIPSLLPLSVYPLSLTPMTIWLSQIMINVRTVLNDYFASVFTVDDGLLPEFVPRLSENKSLHCVLFPFDKVLKSLKSLPSKCSITSDGFPAFYLKSLAPAIAFALSLLFEMSMSTGHIPLVWKTAFLCPVFKKGSRKQPSNYRPISQTCILCKVMESIISSPSYS